MVKSPSSPASLLSSCSSEIEDAAIWNHVANSLNMEITDLDNLASCDGASLIDRVAAAVEASCSAGGLRGDVFGAIDEVLEGEEWIITDWVEPSSHFHCIWGRYVDADGDFFCGVTVPRFEGSSVYDLRFNVEPLPDRVGSTGDYTDESDPYFMIRLDQDYVNLACDINILRTIVHESINAELLAYAKDQSIDPLDFASAYEFYREDASLGHNVMAELYRGRIEQALKSVFGNEFSNEEYKAFAWIGLSTIDSYGNTIPSQSEAWNQLLNQEKTQILNTVQDVLEKCGRNEC